MRALSRLFDRFLRVIGAAALVALPLALSGQAVTGLSTFSNGTVANATAVNDNFAALADAMNSHDLTLAKFSFSGNDLTLPGALNTSGVAGSNCRMRMFTSGPVDINVALAGYTDAQCVWVNNGIRGWNGSACYYGLDPSAEWDNRDLPNHFAVHSSCGNAPGLLVCCK